MKDTIKINKSLRGEGTNQGFKYSVNRLSRDIGATLTGPAGGAVMATAAALTFAAPLQAATFVVDSTSDTSDINPGDGACVGEMGSCSLRAAVREAGATAAADTILFDSSISGSTIALNARAGLYVCEPLSIDGGGNAITVDANDNSPHFRVACMGNSPRDVSIANLTLINGNSGFQGSGGSIYASDQNLSLSNMVFRSNRSGNNGGAIAIVGGTLTVSNSTLEDNLVYGDGGAIYATGADVTINNNSQILANETSGQGTHQGSGISILDGDLSVSDSLIDGNFGTYTNGVGIAFVNTGLLGAGNLYISNSEISNNASNPGATNGGGIYIAASDGGNIIATIADSMIMNNLIGGYGGGVAISAVGMGDVFARIRFSLLFGNRAAYDGGGIHFDNASGASTLFVNRSTLDSNVAINGSGGGIQFQAGDGTASLDIVGSTLAANTANSGAGGLDVNNFGASAADFTVVNSTISGNTGGSVGGVSAFFATINHTTIAGNQASGGFFSTGGLSQSSLLYKAPPATDVVLLNSIVANNTLAGNANDTFGPIGFQYSLVEYAGGGYVDGGGNIIGQDPYLGPLISSGPGQTAYHPLYSDSPAVNAGDPNFSSPPSPSTDQTGKPRVIFGRLDMGAYEFGGPLIVNLSFSDTGYVDTVNLPEDGTGTNLYACLNVGQFALQDIPVDLTSVFGSAGPADYTLPVSLTILQGARCGSATIAPQDDITLEPDETVTVSIDNLSVPPRHVANPAHRVVTATIVDNDDADGDGIADTGDSCPITPNPDQLDLDGDGIGNVCDDDVDGDEVANAGDSCPITSNPDQLDLDGDGIGNVCDDDLDGDEVANTGDNCPIARNRGQLDLDGDDLGNLCDLDDDGDSLPDESDPCPLSVSNQCDLIASLPNNLALCEDADPAPIQFVVNQQSGTQSLLLNSSVDDMALADLDADGDQDMALLQGRGERVGVVSFWFQTNEGEYRPVGMRPTGYGPTALVTADFNADGLADVAVANQSSDDVTVIMNKGKGRFARPVRVDANGSPQDIAVLDAGADGDPDLAVVNVGLDQVSILANDGIGEFRLQGHLDVGKQPVRLASADFNGDEWDDLAVINHQGNSVTVLMANGAGGFKAHSVGNLEAPRLLATGDFDGDGDMDLALAGERNAVLLLENRAAGRFENPVVHSIALKPQGFATADLDGDDVTDLIVSGKESADVAVLLHPGTGNATWLNWFDMGARPGGVFSADLDNDGLSDLLMPHANSARLSMFFNQGEGHFTFDTRRTKEVSEQPTSKAIETDVVCVSADAEWVIEDNLDTPEDEGPRCVAVDAERVYKLDFALVPDAYTTALSPLVTVAIVESAGDRTFDMKDVEGVIAPVNDAPGFVAGPDESAIATQGEVVTQGWASGIRAGPANEAGQSLNFILTPADPSLFTPQGQPRVDAATGNLMFTPAPAALGETQVSVVLQDTGPGSGDNVGACMGHVNRSEPSLFTVSVVPEETTLELDARPAPPEVQTANLPAGTVRVANNGDTGALDVKLTATATGGELLGGFSQAPSCQIITEDDGDLVFTCDQQQIPDWQCEITGETLNCALGDLMSGGTANLLIRVRPTGSEPVTVSVEISAFNADGVVQEIVVGG